ncbi:DUF1989 domain-containing protein [Mycolicibacterium aichiense]|uniref:DUF1989 domain-containing protein n=1 Tax=Mycolicibacterium aichiense TaxID=1799 RepID=A0AAD1HXV3_9MYCO|nr:urea carboxylase-associated family protein [Mycolicibacterium aichiense]MCV7016922.1 urea carboxylase-associated family protein [Mycolicibacterium aichiense]BBX10656.1 hypothetical protein MAIC_54590 [Mycolicibacterium aichiense]STZ25687.1 urea carboxylase-associated protein 1 [Mycolicibacterium aichiense]
MVVPTSDVPTTVEIPAQSGAVVTLAAGHRLKIIDIEGSQVADLFAVSASDLDEWLSVPVTRACTWRLFPAVGQSFFSTAYRPLLTFERDDSPGAHDMLEPPCSAEMYRAMAYAGYHPSCSENFRTAAVQVDWHPQSVPDPVNFFQRSPVEADGSFTALPALTSPGDSVTLRAETAVHVVVTACSMDLEPINGDHCTPLRLEVGP